MLKYLRGYFSPDVSIDLGTANTLVHVRGQGIVLDEPSVVAVRKLDGAVLAVGLEARKMMGRTPDEVSVIQPMRDGQIADFLVTEQMLRHFIRQAIKNNYLQSSPRVLICVPCQSTEVEKRAIRDSAQNAGAREVYLIEEPLAAAVGANLNVQDPVGCMVVDIGGGTTDVAIISMNGVVISESIRCGGDEFDRSIVVYVRQKEGCVIGEVTAERIKMLIGSAIPVKDDAIMEIDVNGHDLSRGVPKRIVLDSNDILEAMATPTERIVEATVKALQQCPPELSADIADTGIMLTGGGALLKGLDQLLQQEIGLPVMQAEEPLQCVAKGCGIILDEGLIDKLTLPG